MSDPFLGLDIVFNGCIYNYRELRSDLEEEGYHFFSEGDTEVILKAYHAWGMDCVSKLNGMFAFVIFERDSDRRIMARDRLGIKPLYPDDRDEFLRFASSLPVLLVSEGIDTDINLITMHHYLHWLAVVPALDRILKGMTKLPTATIRMLEPDSLFKEMNVIGLEKEYQLIRTSPKSKPS